MTANSLFCKICANLLTVVTTADNFYFKCSKCQEVYQPTEKDTIRHEEIKGSELSMYKMILLNAGMDPVNPKVKRTCTCGHNLAKQVRLGSEMRVINICTSCNRQWYEGIEM